MTQRRLNLHSIISKISGNVEQGSEADTQEPLTVSATGSADNISDDKAASEMKIAEPQEPMSKMLSNEEKKKQATAIKRINKQLLDPNASSPFICDLCSVAFYTKRELQLHVMCHGIHISGNLGGQKVTALIQRPNEESLTTDTEMKNGISSEDAVVVNSEVKRVDVLSLATATRGFKEPGSIWCSLCKCTVDKSHTCKVYQPSYHAEKTTDEGFTCELCGRFYNQKRKLRTHLRNRHKGFRLQEDEGYMCWQCWQAFPEIKILEEHIVQVHGHESRRQNSTWRPFTQPSTLPLDENNTDQTTSPDPNSSPGDQSNIDSDQLNAALKRASSEPSPSGSSKKPNLDLNGVISVAEVDGKIVVTDSTPTEIPQPPLPNKQIPINPVVTPEDVVEVAKKPEVDNGSKPEVNGKIVANGVISGIETNEVTAAASDIVAQKPAIVCEKQRCPHCPGKFPKKYMLQLHIQEVHRQNMHCVFCSTSCASTDVFISHMKTAHPDEMKNARCPICQCKCLGKLHQHIVQYHHKDLLTRQSKDRVLSTCPICHEVTADAYHLRWHMREHRGLKLQRESTDGEDTGSDSSGSVSGEAGLNSDGSEKISDNTRGHKSTSEGTGKVSTNVKGHKSASEGSDRVSRNTRGHKSTSVGKIEQDDDKEDQPEIVFVSDNNLNSDWPNQAVNGVSVSNGVSPNPSANENVLTESTEKPGDCSVRRESVSPVTYDYESLSEDTCVFCFKKLSKESLASHLRSDHGWVNTFTCPVCAFKADKYLTIVQHFCNVHFHPTDENAKHCEPKCLKCDIIFQDIATLKKHSAALHSFQLASEASYNTFKCRHCNILFEKQYDAQKHFDVYHLFRIRFKCESCRMGFTAKHDFQEHVTCNHPELVNNFCPVCGLGFEVSGDLEEHVFEMHRRKAQFHCAQCGNEFKDRFHVHMHIRSNCCVKWADSNFECLDCLTAFSSINELRIHCKKRSCKVDTRNFETVF